MIGIVVRLEKVERPVLFAARCDESGIVPMLLVLDVYAAGGNEKFGIYCVDGGGDLVRKLLDLGEFHFLWGPSVAFGGHAFRFVEYFPGHQGVVVSDRLDDRDEDVVDKGFGSVIVK